MIPCHYQNQICGNVTPQQNTKEQRKTENGERSLQKNDNVLQSIMEKKQFALTQ